MISFFHKSKIGVFLAYALLSVIIYQRNARCNTRHKVVVRPIEASQFIHEKGVPQNAVGIIAKHHQPVREDEEVDLTKSTMDMEITVQHLLGS